MADAPDKPVYLLTGSDRPKIERALARLREHFVAESIDAVTALDRVSIDLHAGAVHALLGENGSGKSTTVRILTGALTPDEGTVAIDGEPVSFATPRAAIAAGIAAAYQESALVPQLTVAQNVVLGHERALFLPTATMSNRQRRNASSIRSRNSGEISRASKGWNLPGRFGRTRSKRMMTPRPPALCPSSFATPVK